MFYFRTSQLVIGVVAMAASMTLAYAGTPSVTTIYAFDGASSSPSGDIVIGPDGSIYGKTIENPGSITVFRLNPDTGVSTAVFSGNPGTNDDANSGVVFNADGALYGASYYNAGSGQCYAGCGLIFQVNGTTGVLTSVFQFNNDAHGRGTHGVIAGPGGSLYGTSDEGGAARQDSVFHLDPATGHITTIYSFTGGLDGGSADGVGITFGPDGALYGENVSGGEYGHGTLYRLDPHFRSFKVLHPFAAADGNTHLFNTPPNLAFADNGLIYGTTVSGGSTSQGMLFSLDPTTETFTVLHSFSGADGASPTRIVIGKDGSLYGVTVSGGSGNYGTVFKFEPNTGAFSSVYSFTNTTDGAYPGQGGLRLAADGRIYGTTHSGGGPTASGAGTVFKITP